MYIHGQLSVKVNPKLFDLNNSKLTRVSQREMSNAKSPLFSHFSAAFNGIVSIRAYGAQQKVRKEAQRRADKYTRAATAVSAVICFQLAHLLMLSCFCAICSFSHLVVR